ncbi:hypothetical protein CNN82_06815 [Pseudomonas frederiksbergensis]|uniref:Uncharacterized protein n=1 Tax=Pseudomonas frederiksbergensis TaxID=104087 RepID=A0AB33EAM6_9PSED|nr:hypothetical protein CNN82_06815 [Pseudomonas frederiksbergensis]
MRMRPEGDFRDCSIVPTLCVGTPQWTLCVRFWGAERPWLHSHAERGNDLKENDSEVTIRSINEHSVDYRIVWVIPGA